MPPLGDPAEGPAPRPGSPGLPCSPQLYSILTALGATAPRPWLSEQLPPKGRGPRLLIPVACRGAPRPPSERGPHGTVTVVHVCVASARPAGRRLSRACPWQRQAQQSRAHVARTSVSASACPSGRSTERPPRPPTPARLPSALLCSRDDRGGDDRRRPVPEAGPRGTARAAASLVMTSPRR